MKSLYFSDEHKLLRDMVRDFAENEMAPVAIENDRDSKFPADLIASMGPLGLLGIPVPVEHGGAGMDTVAYAVAIHELAKVDASIAITVAAHTSLGTMPILAFGTDEQKKKYLPQLASGTMLGAFGLTEPGAGSDAGATLTKAELKGDKYIVNGQKAFITNASKAGVMVFTARHIEDGQDLGISTFLVDAGTAGLKIGPPEKKMGWHASDTCAVFFEDMEIPTENIVGEKGNGFKQFLQTLTGGRISVGALALGTGEGAYERALAYAQEREAFGMKIGMMQSVGFKLADMATEIAAASHLVYHAAWMKDNGLPIELEAAMAKLFASEMAMRVTTEAIQIHGGYGYIREYEVERFFRDAKVLEIGEGTSEIQRMVIARNILKDQES